MNGLESLGVGWLVWMAFCTAMWLVQGVRQRRWQRFMAAKRRHNQTWPDDPHPHIQGVGYACLHDRYYESVKGLSILSLYVMHDAIEQRMTELVQADRERELAEAS